MHSFSTIRIDTPAKAHILCVDGDPEVLTLLEQQIRQAGHRFEGCCDAATAFDSVECSLPDLMITEVDLGQEDGLSLCQQVRALPHGDEVPILFLSGTATSDLLDRTRNAGGTYFLAKPFDPEVLLELVGKSLWMPHVVRGHLRHATRRSRSI